MKILLISFAYRPSLNPRAFRWGAIAEQWVRQGHEVDVVCEPGPSTFEVIEGVRVHRAGRRIARPSTGAAGAPPAKPSKLKNLLRAAWHSVYWPDYAAGWYFPARRRAEKLMARSRYDLIISSSLPFTGHLVGLYLKSKRKGCPWIVDIGDPFSFADGAPVNNFALYSNLSNAAERRVLQEADAISVTTQGTLERYAQIFPFVREKTKVIPPLVSTLFDTVLRDARQDCKKRLVFVGTLYNDIRSPAPLLDCFARLMETDLRGEFELHFYGSDRGCEHHFDRYGPLIGSKIFRHGLVPQSEAIEAMRRAAVLVNIGNATEYQLPSKVVEYTALAKPILNFTPIESDSSRRFFSEFEGVLSVPSGEAGDDRVFVRIVEFLANLPNVDATRRTAEIEAFRPNGVAAQYLNLVGYKTDGANVQEAPR